MRQTLARAAVLFAATSLLSTSLPVRGQGFFNRALPQDSVTAKAGASVTLPLIINGPSLSVKVKVLGEDVNVNLNTSNQGRSLLVKSRPGGGITIRSDVDVGGLRVADNGPIAHDYLGGYDLDASFMSNFSSVRFDFSESTVSFNIGSGPIREQDSVIFSVPFRVSEDAIVVPGRVSMLSGNEVKRAEGDIIFSINLGEKFMFSTSVLYREFEGFYRVEQTPGLRRGELFDNYFVPPNIYVSIRVGETSMSINSGKIGTFEGKRTNALRFETNQNALGVVSASTFLEYGRLAFGLDFSTSTLYFIAPNATRIQ